MAHGECRSAGGLEEKRAEASLADADTAGPLKIAGAFQLYQQAVGELLTGAAGSFVHRSGGVASTPLSANTSAYSQARSRLPVEVAEKVSDWIFEALNERPQIPPGLGQPMFLLDGSTILLAHSDDLVAHYPPPCNQHGASHWTVIRIVVAHDVDRK